MKRNPAKLGVIHHRRKLPVDKVLAIIATEHTALWIAQKFNCRIETVQRRLRAIKNDQTR